MLKKIQIKSPFQLKYSETIMTGAKALIYPQIKHKDERKFLLCLVNTQEVQLLHHCSRNQGLKC